MVATQALYILCTMLARIMSAHQLCIDLDLLWIVQYIDFYLLWSMCNFSWTDSVTAYFDLLSYLYLPRLIHDVSLIIPELSVLPDRLYRLYIRTCARVNTYWTYPLSRYSATILLNAHTRVSATYLPIPYGYSHAHSPFWSTHSESYPPLYL